MDAFIAGKSAWGWIMGAPKKESSVASEYEREGITNEEGTSVISAFLSRERVFQKVTPLEPSWEPS